MRVMKKFVTVCRQNHTQRRRGGGEGEQSEKRENERFVSK